MVRTAKVTIDVLVWIMLYAIVEVVEVVTGTWVRMVMVATVVIVGDDPPYILVLHIFMHIYVACI